ncbi:MAG TPA: ABC transporter substrate-binding protein [Gallionella sp.]|nr:ABC transporter substrate-binding protein [Gallionella sp.]
MKRVTVLCFLWILTIASMAARAEPVEPDVLIKNIAQDVLAVVKQEGGDPVSNRKRLLTMVDTKVLPHFDFVRMTRLAVGKNWRKATPKQKNTLVAEFRNLLVNTYTNTFTRYQNQTVEVRSVVIEDVNEVTVRTLILEPGAQRTTVDYEMEKTPDGWKVFDLTVEGVSLVISYRSSFTREVRLGGIDRLIKTLVDKNAANNASH